MRHRGSAGQFGSVFRAPSGSEGGQIEASFIAKCARVAGVLSRLGRFTPLRVAKNPKAAIEEPKRENPRRTRGSRSELAGLEPAASWVRSRRALALSLVYLRGFRGGGGTAAAPNFRQFPLISAGIGPKKRRFGPISGRRCRRPPAAVQTISCQPSSARRPASSSSRSAIRSRRLIRFVGHPTQGRHGAYSVRTMGDLVPVKEIRARPVRSRIMWNGRRRSPAPG